MTKVEAPKNRRFCLHLKVMSLPTYLFFKDRKEVARLSGNISLETIEQSINKLL
jgi:thioredoxin 1